MMPRAETDTPLIVNDPVGVRCPYRPLAIGVVITT